MPDKFTILTVCTGNICRSPLAKKLLELELQGVEQIELDSAGIHAMVGEGMPEFSLKIARQNGVINPENHVAQQISEALISSANLVLAMDRGHRKAIVQLSPRATRKVFTVRDLARLIDTTRSEDLQEELKHAGESISEKLNAAIEAARLSRSDLVGLNNPEDEDVIDPYGKSESAYEESADQLIPSIRLISSYLKSALET